MSKELRIGVVGTGAIGRTHIDRINTRLKGGKIVAVSDVNTGFGQQVAKQYGCDFFEDGEELIFSEKVDAAIITTIDEYHEKYVTGAVKAGKFCFVEKPLAPNQEGCKRIVKAEMAGGRRLVQVGFMRRYDPGYKQLKKYVAEKTFGEPLMLHCAHRNFDVPGNYTNAMAVENTMIHEIDVLRWLLGEEYASVEVVYPKTTKYAQGDLKDPQIMYLTTESGVRIDVEAFVNCHYGYDIKCEVCCEEGTISLPEPANAMLRTNVARSTPICREWSERFVEAFDVEIQEWIDSSLKGVVKGPNSWDGYVGQITASAASKARDTQKTVKIDMEPCPDFYL